MHVQPSRGFDIRGALCAPMAHQESILKMFLKFWSVWEIWKSTILHFQNNAFTTMFAFLALFELLISLFVPHLSIPKWFSINTDSSCVSLVEDRTVETERQTRRPAGNRKLENDARTRDQLRDLHWFYSLLSSQTSVGCNCGHDLSRFLSRARCSARIRNDVAR